MLILEKNVENDGIRYPRVAIDFEWEKNNYLNQSRDLE